MLLEHANRALGRLDGLASLFPDPDLFIYFYVRKEALLSSQIEGTQSSLSDLLLFENEEVPGVPLDDVQEVSCYVAAMNYGLERLRSGFPISLRLLREIHGRLLNNGRGAEKDPGEFRRQQNWIGGSRPSLAMFVPPPPDRLQQCLDEFERFLHEDPPTVPLLVKAAMAHAQFETIHPFLDGNGRLGRLLITLLLCAEDAMAQPILYLSLYFKANRDEYYQRLQLVRERADWEGWIKFFLQGVKETSEQAAAAGRRILTIFDEDRKQIDQLGRASGSAMRLFQALQRKPMLTIPTAAERLQLSQPAVTTAFANLAQLNIASEATGRQRGRVFVYNRYLAELAQGTEPIAR
ncbi:Fic family protein [Burkholderia gladioli]|uniref:Fic family protein n=1 Tax=Burkholderia gladioli TaxID=28095 RepID=UPI001FC89028|nr:Fic family protein [Burkholderia gladioli]